MLKALKISLLIVAVLSAFNGVYADDTVSANSEPHPLVSLAQKFVEASNSQKTALVHNEIELEIDEALSNYDFDRMNHSLVSPLISSDLKDIYELTTAVLYEEKIDLNSDSYKALESCAVNFAPALAYKCSISLSFLWHEHHENTRMLEWAEKAVSQSALIPAEASNYWYARFQSYELLFMAFVVDRNISETVTAGEYYLEAMQKAGISEGYYHSINNLSTLARKEVGPILALQVTETVEPFVEDLSENDREIMYYALGRNYLENGDFKHAKEYFGALEQINVRKDVKMARMALSSYLYAKLGEKNKALLFIKEMRRDYADSLDNEFGKYVLMGEKELAILNGLPNKALEIDNKIDSLTQTLFERELSADRARISNNLQITSERNKREMDKLEYEASLTAQTARAQELLLWVSLAAIIFILLLLLYAFRGYLRERGLNKQIKITNRDLNQANEQLNTMFGELKVAHKKALAGVDAKEKFIGVVGHELRTPLNPIINLASILEQKSTDRQDRALLKAIKNAGKRLHIIVENMLAISSDSEHSKTYIEIIDAVDNAATILREFSSEINNRNIELKQRGEFLKVSIDKDPEFKPQHLSNKVIYRAIVRNLFDNALKFTKSGEIKLSLSELKDGPGFALRVKDTGEGMDGAKISELFRPFEQGDMNLNRAHEGAGLGLAVVMKYCDQISARVDIKSQVNVGTCITIEFPQPNFVEETGELLIAA
ncbi:MAG: HAMP domain-containing histidine kinase [Hellea sp.]|nr:HAMP domain-containing histidine kinase [Hellea sp.]